MKQCPVCVAEHRLNEYCTPEYSSPQLIAAITSLPAPVMNDTANDMWSLGVILFQMLMNTIPNRQMPFDASKEQSLVCGREELLQEVQKTIQQQHDEWVSHRSLLLSRLLSASLENVATLPF